MKDLTVLKYSCVLRTALNLTITDVAKQTGLSPATVQRYENLRPTHTGRDMRTNKDTVDKLVSVLKPGVIKLGRILNELHGG